ncbi:endopeptidase La [Buchnera aphidicola (Kurisakia onigurumii)]|uniref:endopeptidase La n=1 Tax=Buchnera aphidicola TaxID=9 RepID=UPI0031B72472
MNLNSPEKIIIPVLPLRDIVVYPKMVISLFVGRKKSIQCIKKSMENDKKIILVTQKDPSLDKPLSTDLFNIGTISLILQMLQLPDGTIKILVQGINRTIIESINDDKNYFTASIKKIYYSPTEITQEQKVLIKIAIEKFDKFTKINKKIPVDILESLKKNNQAEEISDIIAANIPLQISEKQSILETFDIKKKLEYLIKKIESEIELLEIEKKIRIRIKQQMEKSQREYYLNEQIKAIQKELGDIEDIPDEYEKLKNKIKKTKMTKEAKEKVHSEFKKLKMMSSMSAEASVIRSYIDWILEVPWNNSSKIKKDIAKAKKILDQDHFGLNTVKERILEYLAVQNRTKKSKGPILCLVGPPGVGKTSLGKSIARATGRKYIRIALGGIRDEAEIRGHRRTYIGSMPGKIIQKMAKVKVKNPLFLLDEIDKMSNDIRVDPASALLEVLDPEQNFTFNDHYLELDFDLSNVLFIATSNSTNIPSPLLDRMEIIKISGYTEEEKINISKNYLIEKQKKRNAIKKNELTLNEEVLTNIIRYYTRESGVRNLEREISKICRKVVKKIFLDKKIKNIVIDNKNLKKYLGTKKFDYGKTNNINKIGQVIGLAWTEVGGELLNIETACISGKGKLILTGSLGKVMQESIQAALTVVRSQSKILGIKKDFYEKCDIHVHVPEGATPKDGPSAGISMCTALVSSLTKIPVRSDVAMTGEITLIGHILNIGGLKEKILAAHRGGIKTVLIPYDNLRNVEDIPKNITKHLNIYPVKTIREVLKYSLEKNPYDQ